MSVNFSAFVEEFHKIAARPISKEEAERSLGKLKSIEENRDLGALGRAAATGAAFMPVAGAVSRVIGGSSRIMKPGAKFNVRKPLGSLKAVNWGGLGREAASDAAMGALGGGALPLLREKVETSAQKEKLRDYIEQQEGRKSDKGFRRRVTEYTGV